MSCVCVCVCVACWYHTRRRIYLPYARNRAGRRDLGRCQVKTTPDLCFLPSLVYPFLFSPSLSLRLSLFPFFLLSRALGAHVSSELIYIYIYTDFLSVRCALGQLAKDRTAVTVANPSFLPLVSFFFSAPFSFSLILYRSREYARTCVCRCVLEAAEDISLPDLLFTLLPRLSLPPPRVLVIKRCALTRASSPQTLNVILQCSQIRPIFFTIFYRNNFSTAHFASPSIHECFFSSQIIIPPFISPFETKKK